MAFTIQPIELITTDPAVKEGRPCVRGTSIRVLDVVAPHVFHRQTPEEIASNFSLSLAQVHACLAYYYLHIDAINADMQAEDLRFVTLTEKMRESGKTQLLSGRKSAD